MLHQNRYRWIRIKFEFMTMVFMRAFHVNIHYYRCKITFYILSFRWLTDFSFNLCTMFCCLFVVLVPDQTHKFQFVFESLWHFCKAICNKNVFSSIYCYLQYNIVYIFAVDVAVALLLLHFNRKFSFFFAASKSIGTIISNTTFTKSNRK